MNFYSSSIITTALTILQRKSARANTPSSPRPAVCWGGARAGGAVPRAAGARAACRPTGW